MSKKKRARPESECDVTSCRAPIDGEHRGGCAISTVIRVCQECAKKLMIHGYGLRVDAEIAATAPTSGAAKA